MDIIYCLPLLVMPTRKHYNLQEEEDDLEEEEEEIEAWFCLFPSAKSSVLTLQFRIFLHT